MAHPLDDIRARLFRAEENITNLKGEIAEFRRLYPHVVHSNLDAKTGELRQNLRQQPAPPRLSVLAGEILFLLRSSLDHIVAQLLIPITAPSDLDAVLERSCFPIYTDRGKWKSFDWTKIPGVSSQIRAAITDCQPCNRTDGLPPEDHPLAVLTSLNNIDKHRTLLVLTSKVLASHLINPSGHASVRAFTMLSNFDSTQLDTEILHAQLDLGLGGGVEVTSQVVVEIAFQKFGLGESEPVIPGLKRLSKCVTALTDDFQSRFFP